LIRRVVVTGASRGLGLEFTRQYLQAECQVFALAREPLRSQKLMDLAQKFPRALLPVTCDVGEEDSVQTARQEVELAAQTLDLVINNAATYGRQDETLDNLSWDEVQRVFNVNTLGPMRVTRAFLPLLRLGSRPRVVHVTSMMGSVSDNRSGGHWSYRVSKAALHMANRNLAIQTAKDKIPCVLISPGWVRTDMGGPEAPLTAEESVAAMVQTIDTFTMSHTGNLYRRDGKPEEW
jgi:NAD(P)-dependent dehydrogenase (short-subunit alcohol dehydrogenase family)